MEGWLLDAYIEGGKAILWLKLDDGRTAKFAEPYRPYFYAEPKGVSAEHFAEILSEHPDIVEARRESRFTRLDEKQTKPVLRVAVSETRKYKAISKQMKSSKFVKEVYNADLLHIQRYLYDVQVAPMMRVSFTSNADRLTSLEAWEDDLRPEPPPFKVSHIILEGHTDILQIVVDEGGRREMFEGHAKDVIESLQNYLEETNPDILVGYEDDLKRIQNIAEKIGTELSIGREPSNERSFRIKGRVLVSPHSFNRMGLAGLAERSRFTMVPVGLCAEWPAGKTIDSRQCFEAHRRGYLIPTAGFFQHTASLHDLVDLDRGGLILTPEVGLHESVASLDFESMFPHIIVRRNVSYETVQPRRAEPGLMVGFTDETLKRRMHFKHLRREFQQGSKEWRWCEQRQLALKEVLVCDYGYSGCFANRFGNLVTYQTINQIARDTLVKSMNVAQSLEFRILYGNNDSLFVSRPDATREDYEELAATIASKVGLPMALDKHFKFLVLLPQKSRQLGAANHFYGKLMDGGFECRGIELRRGDTPPLIKRFQRRLMEILLDAESVEEVRTRGIKRAWKFVKSFCDELKSEEHDAEDFMFSRVLRKPLHAYRSMAPHVAAAWNLSLGGSQVEEGDLVKYVFVSKNSNPLRRVQPKINNRSSRVDYDKYTDLIAEAANSILGVFQQPATPLTIRWRLKSINGMDWR